MELIATENLVFSANDKELLTITPEGELLIKGKPTNSAKAVQAAFLEFAKAFMAQQREKGHTILRISSQAREVEDHAEMSGAEKAIARFAPDVALDYVLGRDIDANVFLGVLARVEHDVHLNIAAQNEVTASAIAQSKALTATKNRAQRRAKK